MSESLEFYSLRVPVDTAGRIVLPAALRHELDIKPGQELILSADARGIYLQTFAQAAKAAQDAFAPYRVAGVSVVDDLIGERQKEARREKGE